MDADMVVSSPDFERVEENGVHSDKPYEGDKTLAAEMINEKLDSLQIPDANASLEVHYVTEGGDVSEPSPTEVTSDECQITNCSPALGEVDLQEKHHEKTKEQMSQGKSKTAKPFCPKIAGQVSLKKTSSGKEEKVTSNGISSSGSRPKQPIMVSTKSLNGGRIATGNTNKIKPTLTSSNTKKTKQPSKSESGPSSDNVSPSNDTTMEKTKLKPLKKEPQHKMEGDQDSTGSPVAGDVKPLKVSKLPAYDFSFRCNERAEKRKEFYTKLEEKIHAKEAEISNQEAKSKETQEAELKMLRKSLNFKATPMPTFYQEPTPAKVELKKIPTTRPKSPKLGRRKSSPPAAGDTDVSDNQPKARVDLGEKISQNKPAKTVVHPHKPQRKSLPKLPSQKTPLSKTTGKALPSSQMEPEAVATELGQTESIIETEQAFHLEEGHDMSPKEPEQVTVEQ